MGRPSLVYIGDPMCSWCYGFRPQLSALQAASRDGAELRVLLGDCGPAPRSP